MFKKKTALNVRPQPPSFAEMTEDINSADSNDIIFTQLKSGMMDDQCYHCADLCRGSISMRRESRGRRASWVGYGEGVTPPLPPRGIGQISH